MKSKINIITQNLCIPALIMVFMAFAAPINLTAQLNCASFYTNNASVTGTNNCGFGYRALNTGVISSGNTATGYFALNAHHGGEGNTANGNEALKYNYDAGHNTAVGNKALTNNDISQATTAIENTAVGDVAMENNDDGRENTAIGAYALHDNVQGNGNAAVGFEALWNNLVDANTACGYRSLKYNVSGLRNTAVGYSAIGLLGSGGVNPADDNTGIGYLALSQNTAGIQNTAVGSNALAGSQGDNNTAIGYKSQSSFSHSGADNVSLGSFCMYTNTDGTYNTAVGTRALENNWSGYYNAAFGTNALNTLNGAYGNGEATANAAFGGYALANTTTASANTGIGYGALNTLTSGSYNTSLGYATNPSAGTHTNATGVGNSTQLSASDRVVLGNANVSNNDVTSYGTYNTISDGRFKSNINEDDVKGLVFIKLLRPVVYNFEAKRATAHTCKGLPEDIQKIYLDVDYTKATKERQSGFIAQEVETAAKTAGYNFNGVSAPTNDNDTYSLAYAQFVVPLVKAVQEQQQMIEQQKDAIEKLEQALHTLNKASDDKMNSTGINSGAGLLNISEPGFEMDAQPNPFSDETVITFTLPGNKTATAYISICDLSGKQLKTYPIAAGGTSVTVTSEKLDAGIYIYSIIASNKIMGSKRMVVSGK